MEAILILLSVCCLSPFFATGADVENPAEPFSILWCRVFWKVLRTVTIEDEIVGRSGMPKALAMADRKERHFMAALRNGRQMIEVEDDCYQCLHTEDHVL